MTEDQDSDDAEELYVRAIQLATRGFDDEANCILQRLGCCFRLAPAALQSSRQTACDLRTAPLHTFADPLPGGVLRDLQRAFAPHAAFWSDHGYYNLETPFFSYTCSLATPPVALIDVAIQHLYAALQKSNAAEWLGRVTQAEWWAHCRQPGDSHQLHFDVDETCLRQGRSAYTLRHPVLSSVLYLGHSGGPTLIIDQTSSCRSLGATGWAVHPVDGRLAIFKGDLLHGVLPGAGELLSDEPRISIIVAWWDCSLQPAAASAPQGPVRQPPWASGAFVDTIQPGKGSVGPKALTSPMAEARYLRQTQSNVQGRPQWVADMMQTPDEVYMGVETSGKVVPLLLQPEVQHCTCIHPVWQPVEVEPVASTSTEERTSRLPIHTGQTAKRMRVVQGVEVLSKLTDSPLPPLRFFLRSADEIFDTFNPPVSYV